MRCILQLKFIEEKLPSQPEFLKDQKNFMSTVSVITLGFLNHILLSPSLEKENIIDIDGNKYVDYWMGHWSLILGHAAPQVATLVKKQLPSCWMHGTVNEMTLSFSEVIQKAVPVAEKIR